MNIELTQLGGLLGFISLPVDMFRISLVLSPCRRTFYAVIDDPSITSHVKSQAPRPGSHLHDAARVAPIRGVFDEI